MRTFWIDDALYLSMAVTKYSVRVEFGPAGLFLYPDQNIRRFWSGLDLSPAGPNISGIFGPAGLKYSTISGSGY